MSQRLPEADFSFIEHKSSLSEFKCPDRQAYVLTTVPCSKQPDAFFQTLEAVATLIAKANV